MPHLHRGGSPAEDEQELECDMDGDSKGSDSGIKANGKRDFETLMEAIDMGTKGWR